MTTETALSVRLRSWALQKKLTQRRMAIEFEISFPCLKHILSGGKITGETATKLSPHLRLSWWRIYDMAQTVVTAGHVDRLPPGRRKIA